MYTPWFAIAAVEKDREYLALLSGLPLKSYRGFPRLVGFVVGAVQQMYGSRGAVGVTLCARFLTRTFWTLSAWQDEQALQDFVMKKPHLDAMKEMQPYMNAAHFLRWKVTGSDLPLRWVDAMRRFEQGAQK
jgi:Domain of unknown function (DUF3291)